MRALMANRSRQRRAALRGQDAAAAGDQAQSSSHSDASSADGDYDPAVDIVNETAQPADRPDPQENAPVPRPAAKRGRPPGSGKTANLRRRRVDIPWHEPTNAQGTTWGLAREALILYRDKAAPC